MREGLREAGTSVAHTISHTFVFAGRSRRLDIGYYWVASILFTGALKLAVSGRLDWAALVLARQAIDVVAVVPFLALFARRLHDQGRSAWWTLVLPPLVAANVYREVRVTFQAFDPTWPELGLWWTLGLLILGVTSFVLMFYPSDVGANGYGDDPRLSEPVSGTT